MTTTSRARRLAPIALAFALLVGLVAVPLALPASAVAPAIPTDLTANSDGGGNTTFNWTATPGATRYQLKCEQQGYSASDLVIVGATTANFRLPTGYNDCYLRAGNNVPEWSDWGIHALASVFPVAPAPTGLSRSAYDHAVTLHWANSSQYLAQNGWRITSTPATTPVYYSQSQTPLGGTPSTTVSGLTIGVTYTFHLETARSYGPSGQFWQYGTAVDFAPITIPPVPGAPSIVDIDANILTGQSTGTVDVTWAAPVANGSPPIDKYRLIVHEAEGGEWSVEYGPGVFFGQVSLGLDLSAWARVQARNVNGWGPLSPVSASVLMDPKPARPRNLFSQTETGGVIRLKWDAPTDLTNYPAPLMYDIRVEGPVNWSSTNDSRSIQIAATLTPGWYLAKVRGIGTYNNSQWVTRWFAVGTPCDPAFSDVTGEPFCTPISWMVRQGIGSGFPGGLFKPTAVVTRQAMASFLYKAKGSPNGPTPTCTTAPFPDVPADHPFCGQIKWLVDQGITAGYPDGTFKPTGSVTRQALASFLFKASDRNRLPGGGVGTPEACSPPGPFTDVPNTQSFCGAIVWLAAQGVTSGYSDGTFQPSAAVSRQAMAAFLYRWQP